MATPISELFFLPLKIEVMSSNLFPLELFSKNASSFNPASIPKTKAITTATNSTLKLIFLLFDDEFISDWTIGYYYCFKAAYSLSLSLAEEALDF